MFVGEFRDRRRRWDAAKSGHPFESIHHQPTPTGCCRRRVQLPNGNKTSAGMVLEDLSFDSSVEFGYSLGARRAWAPMKTMQNATKKAVAHRPDHRATGAKRALASAPPAS
jgi:hypothetical protein